ncbi:angiotensin-converting enzyme, partial [Biomphalaria glabrata]
MCSRCYHVAVLCYTALWVGVRGLINDSQAIQDFLTDYNRKAAEVMYEYAEASWTFNTNITDYNQKMMLDLQLKADKFSQDASRNASQYNLTVMSQSDRRQFIKIMDIGTAAQTNETKMIRLNKITSDMESIYSTATVCLNKTNCVPLDP